MPEDTVPVGVEGDGSAATLHQDLHQQEVIAGVFLLTEEGVDHRTGGIVHRDQQRERWHALLGHPLAAHPVFGRTPLSRTAQSGVDQDAPQGRPADFDALSLAQQLAQMGVVGPCVTWCEPDEPQQLQRARESRWGLCGRGGRGPGRLRPVHGKPPTCAWCGVG